MSKVLSLMFLLLLFSSAHACSSKNVDEISYWHKAGISVKEEKSVLSISVQNASFNTISLIPIVFLNGIQVTSPELKYVDIKCDATHLFALPISYNSKNDIIHVFYQRQPNIANSLKNKIIANPKNFAKSTITIQNAFFGVDLDVIHNRTTKKLSNKVFNTYNSYGKTDSLASYFMAAKASNYKTFDLVGRTNRISHQKIKISNSYGMSSVVMYVTCLSNGKQLKSFRGKPVAKISLKENESAILDVDIGNVYKGLNYAHCYVLNGLEEPETMGGNINTPINIAGIYLFR